jgi:toxin-antitoxin system PIN domain toxin
MILVDANVLIYAANRAAPEHDTARAWLDARLSGTARVAMPWPSLLAFVRLVTNPLVMRTPVPSKVAWQQVRDWLGCDPVWIPLPTHRHLEIIGKFFELQWMTSRLVPDAHLAALAIEHGLTLCSTDGDFGRFPGLAWTNPLAQGEDR